MINDDMSEAGISPHDLREVFQEARARITRGWTRVVAARDKQGNGVAASDPEAVCWCALGAVRAAMGAIDLDMTLISDTLGDLYRGALVETGFRTVVGFNDTLTTTVDDVLAFFDRILAMIALIED
jgi:hypothetical protein